MRLTLIGAMATTAMVGVAVAAPAAPDTPTHMQAVPAASPVHAGPSAVPPRHGPAVVEHYVELNSASRAELMTLPGIGAPEAARIVANRPYLVKTDLVTKNVLPVGPFLSLRHLVVAMPKTPSKGRH